jgi:hypothetical protein
MAVISKDFNKKLTGIEFLFFIKCHQVKVRNYYLGASMQSDKGFCDRVGSVFWKRGVILSSIITLMYYNSRKVSQNKQKLEGIETLVETGKVIN